MFDAIEKAVFCAIQHWRLKLQNDNNGRYTIIRNN